MAKLTDLPVEILEQIAAEVGGPNLRQSVDNLLFCRKWFDAVEYIYNYGLETSTIKLYGCNIARFKTRHDQPGQRLLMHKQTRDLVIRTLGHWWDENRKEDDEATDYLTGSEWRAKENVPPEVSRQGSNHHISLAKEVHPWQRRSLFPTLEQLSGDVCNFEVLDSVSLEALIDYAREVCGPRHAYLPSSLPSRLLRKLPVTHALKKLTLDLGVGLDYDEPYAAHICEDVAAMLHRVEVVRLRLAIICPSIFELPESAKSQGIRLKSFSLKLYQPGFDEHTSSRMPRGCFALTGSLSLMGRHQPMLRAAIAYMDAITMARHTEAADLPQNGNVSRGQGLELYRMSFVRPGTPVIQIADCLRMESWDEVSGMTTVDESRWACWFEGQDSPFRGPLDTDDPV